MPSENSKPYSFAEAKGLMAGHIRAYAPGKAITRFEVKVKPLDQMCWLAAQRQAVKVFGANHDDTAAIAGVGQAVALTGKGPIKLPQLFARLRGALSPQYPYLQWYGGFCFDPRHTSPAWKNFGSWHFVLPRFELARDGKKMIFCCNISGKVDKKALLAELDALQPPLAGRQPDMTAASRKDKPGRKQWDANVNKVLGDIGAGRCQKVVLARQTDLTFKQTLQPWPMLKTLGKVTPNSYHFGFEFNGTVFLGASPERLYQRFGRKIVSEALAGTKPRSVKPAALLASAKDRHEHQIVIDTIRAQLGPLCQALQADPQPSIRTLSNGHHLVSRCQGLLKDGVNDEDILKSLHPTPALAGLPRPKAMDSIRHLEPFGRGWYGGPLGYVGLDWAEFVVGIRSALVKGKSMSVFAGAGIVDGSKPADEWDEVENKISNFLKIIK